MKGTRFVHRRSVVEADDALVVHPDRVPILTNVFDSHVEVVEHNAVQPLLAARHVLSVDAMAVVSTSSYVSIVEDQAAIDLTVRRIYRAEDPDRKSTRLNSIHIPL